MLKYSDLIADITNIRYSDLIGKIDFDYRGTTITIREPMDVMLVGYDDSAKKYLAVNYGFLLSLLY